MRLWVQSLALLSGLRIWRCRELWRRSQTRLGSGVAVALALLWLWHRPVATAQIRPLAWEPPYTMGVALKEKKERKRERGNCSKYIYQIFYIYLYSLP